MPMPFTEEVDNLSQLPEEFIMQLNLQENQDSKNQFSYVKLLLQLMQWEEYIQFSIKEEVLLVKKNKLQELHLILSELSYQSVNHSDLPLL